MFWILGLSVKVIVDKVIILFLVLFGIKVLIYYYEIVILRVCFNVLKIEEEIWGFLRKFEFLIFKFC